MARLFILDAMALAYRAYYAFIGRPLTHVIASSEHPGVVRLRDVPTVPHQNARMAEGGGGSIEIEDDRGDVLQRIPVPRGVYLRADEGERVMAGKVLLAENTSAVYGFANTALKIRREERPDFWALAWDGPGPTHRHEAYAEYKATRKPMPEDLLLQIPAIEDMAQALGLPVLEVEGAEADDVMATLARRAAAEGLDVVLVTSDKDMLQLVGERVRLLSPVGRGEEYAWVDRASVIEKWGVAPEQIRDVLALMGDSIDNVPGVPGVGQKTAVELISRFGSIEGIYERLSEIGKKALVENLSTNREHLILSRKLVTVKTDCDLPYTWEDLKCAPIRRDALRALAQRLELQRLVRIAEQEGVPDGDAGNKAPGRSHERRGTAAETPAPGVLLAPSRPAEQIPPRPPAPDLLDVPHSQLSHSAAAAVPERAAVEGAASGTALAAQGSLELWSADDGGNLEEFEARLHAVRARGIHGVAILPVVAGEEPRTGTLLGVALATRDGTTAYAPLKHPAGPNFPSALVREWLAPLLADADVPKVSEDLKGDAHVLSAAGLPLEGMAFDLHLGSFICDPERDHSLEALAADFLGLALPPLEGAPEKGAARSSRRAFADALTPAAAAAWAERRAALVFPVADALKAQIDARDQWALYRDLELPLIPVLLEMERTGVLLDRPVLAAMSAECGAAIARLEAELYELAGEKVNLNSGPQLSRILFEKLGLKAGRRTKTGFSTDQAVLEELAGSHSFPARLLEYRALAKLQSTYLDALPEVADPHDGRVHTTFNQAGAATGRLSSSNPNLQNIPMRSAQGRAIRRAFVAGLERVLVGADYSQIELRIMAHLSSDPNLIEAFERREDVHASTARRIFGVTGELDPALRARAKIVNFGIMYGMGARSLSQQMGIGLAEAQDFIAHYFRVFARVREFLDGTVAEARRRGYVQTLFGRRRYLSGLGDARGDVRSNAERAAINTPIQGSAADLMKLGMIRVHHALMGSHPSARLLVQVHDELLLECAWDEAEAVSARVRAEMEGCYRLRVPLEVSVGRGPTWFDVH